MINIKYNYLIEKAEKLPSNYNFRKRPDPDSCSKKLYDDLLDLYFSDENAENRMQQYGNKPPFYTLFVFVDGEKHLLSSDYIGSSVFWAKEKRVNDEKIVQMLDISRTIGGHIVWPRGGGKLTINTVRGGEKGFYDRFDLTLMALKIFYTSFPDVEIEELEVKKITDNIDIQKHFMEVIKVMNSWDGWLNEFSSFKEFCNRFILKGSFVDEEYKIIDLAPVDPLLPDNYESYMDKSMEAIANRNEYIKNKIQEKPITASYTICKENG